MASNKPSGPVLGKLPVVSEIRCNICQSPNRRHVDKLIAAGFSYLSIAQELQVLDEEFKEKKLDTIRRNVSRHADRHVNIKDRAVRQIIEKRAQEQGVLLEEATGQITSVRSLLDLMVARGHDQLADPDYRVRMADVMEASRMLEDVQRQEYAHKVDVLERQVWAIGQALQRSIKDASILNEIVQTANMYFENPELVDNIVGGKVIGEIEDGTSAI